MPYRIVKKKGSRPWKIVSKETGRIVGSSETKAKAEASARIRMTVDHGWHPTGKRMAIR